MNFTNLQHIVTSVKLFLAMKAAVKTGLPQYIYNRKGEPYLRVVYFVSNVSKGWTSGFQFMAKNQKDVTDIMLAILKTVV